MPVSRSLNKVTLIGNLGADPEVRSTSNGSRVATLSIATSRQWKNQAGEKQEKTEWHRVVLWNNKFSNLADIAERYCKKGDKVYVEGSIEYRSWQDREGQTRYTTEINGRELILLSGKGDGAEAVRRVRRQRVPAGAAARPRARSRSRTSPRRSTPRTTTCRSERGRMRGCDGWNAERKLSGRARPRSSARPAPSGGPPDLRRSPDRFRRRLTSI